MKIPQIEPFIDEEEYKEIKSCFDNKWITEGPKTEKFQEELLKIIGAKYGVFAPNGTLALYLGLAALDIKSGDEVIVPDFTFIASATSVILAGAKPVFIDVNKKNFQIDLSNIDSIITKHTKAIMPVHMYGTVCDMKPIIDIAKKYNLKIIEDAAQAIGVFREGKHAGTFGDVGCFSFFADKTITIGEGGFVVTNNESIYNKLQFLRNQGRKNRGSFIHPEIGYNFRITDLQSAVGLIQLKKLPLIIEKKRKLLSLYKKYLSNLKELTLFEPDDNVDWIPFRVGILVEEPEGLMKYMEENEIQTRSFFYPLHKQPAFIQFKNYSNFPNACYGYEHGICLPIYPAMKEKDVKYICKTIKKYLLKKRTVFYNYYDLLYSNKDYKHEIEFIYQQLDINNIKPIKIIEIGCGTGNHTQEILSKKGIKQLLAVDTDEEMIKRAKNKLSKNNKVKFISYPIDEIKELDFDLAIAMFNVVNYAETEDLLINFFENVFKKLKRNRIFIFDAWNAFAVIKDPPKIKEIKVETSKELIMCTITPNLNEFQQKVKLDYSLKIKNKKANKDKEGKYILNQNIWTPLQILQNLKKAGFTNIKMFSMNNLSKIATSDDWKIMYVAEKN